jgi:hypothetical protein
MNPIKILIYVAIWKRPEITRLHMQNVRRLVEYDPARFEITPFYVVSEDWAETLCNEFGYRFHRTENNPLGRKMNAGLRQFINEPHDFLLGMGSDDFVEPSFLEEYLPYFETRPIFGLKEVYLINEANAMIKRCKVDRGCFGALRVIRWDLLQVAAFDGKRFIGIWNDTQARALDYVSSINIKARTGYFVYPVQIGAKLFDLKNEVNINGFDIVEGQRVRLPIEEIPKELHYLFP